MRRQHRRLRVLATCAALASILASCSQTSPPPTWMLLTVGLQARLAPTSDVDPEHTRIFPRADVAAAAHGTAGENLGHSVDAGSTVTVTEISPQTVANEHIVHVRDHSGHIDGWLVAEETLLPIPPEGVKLIVEAKSGGQPQMLYPEQDDDEGAAIGATSHVTFRSFSRNPGNPEYLVHVDDGPMAGLQGFLMAQELEPAPGLPFRILAPR